MPNLLRDLIREDRAQAMAEYAFALAVITTAAVTTVALVNTNLATIWRVVGARILTAV